MRARMRTEDELELIGKDAKGRVVFTGVPLQLESRFVEAALTGGFTKREFGIIAMMLAVRKMGLKNPKFAERAALKAKLALLVKHEE